MFDIMCLIFVAEVKLVGKL